MDEKYISLIFVGRNDNYGGDFRPRLQHCVNGAYRELAEFKISSEIIFVNYNPLESELAVDQFIQWPKSNEFVTIRIISVPLKYHTSLVERFHVKNVPVLEYFAKNIGIRRANGTYLLLMNPDILIPNQVYQLFAKKKLSKSNYYRVDRVDHNARYDNHQDPQTIYNSAFKVYLKGFQYPLNGFTVSKLRLIRLFNSFRIFFHLKIIVWFRHLFELVGWKPNPHNAEYQYHCNVSGDFMLMHNEIWTQLKGYPENSFISLHTDALMVVAAACSGLDEVVLHQPIFHRDHSRRFDAGDKQISEYRKVYLAFQEKAQKMILAKSPLDWNDDQWGLSGVDLEEIRL